MPADSADGRHPIAAVQLCTPMDGGEEGPQAGGDTDGEGHDSKIEYFMTLGGKKLTTFPVGPEAAAEMFYIIGQTCEKLAQIVLKT